MATSILQSALAKQIYDASNFIFLDATLTRDVYAVATDPADPPAPTTVSYACRAIENQYASTLIANGLVSETDIEILILAYSISVEPRHNDRITIRGNTVTIVPFGTRGKRAVLSDPARATWTCRCMR
jgi:hypothetical protein